jgi:hypothetical protein
MKLDSDPYLLALLLTLAAAEKSTQRHAERSEAAYASVHHEP